MGHIAQRFGFSIGRGTAVLIVLGLVLAGAVYWIGPLRAAPPQLELLAVEDGRLVDELSVRAERDEGTGAVRFPLELAVRNVGQQAGSPRRISFSVPGRFRIVAPQGPLPSEVTPGVPLRRYVLGVGGQPLPPDSTAARLPGLETIWVEAELPDYYCVPRGDVPEFVPAPALDPSSLAQLQVYYSVTTRESGTRSTGLLTLHVEPEQLRVRPAAAPPVFPTTFDESEVEEPELGPLRYLGERQAYCGDPEQPMNLHTIAWQATDGAMKYVVHVDELPRKHLFDLNGDGVIDLETWDVNGDGRFDARREARFPVPDFLRPPPRQTLARGDTLPADQAWLALFNDTDAGPFRFTRVEEVAEAAPQDTAGLGAAFEPLPPPDSAWLARFLAIDDGPFRFSDQPRRAPPQQPGAPVREPPAAGEPPPIGEPVPAPGTPTPTPPQAEPVEVEPEPEPAPEPAPRPPPRRVPLGTPVPRPPGG